MTDNFGLEPQGPDIKRLLLAVGLTTGMLMAYNYYFAPTAAQPIVAQQAAVVPIPIIPREAPLANALATPQDIRRDRP